MTPAQRILTALAVMALLASVLIGGGTAAATVTDTDVLYTLDADFARGALFGVNHDAPNGDQLQVNAAGGGTAGVIWVPRVTACAVTKLDAESGAILGEYRTQPACPGWDPDWYDLGRTAVARDGSVWYWASNQQGLTLALMHIGLVEAGQCVDRNGNGSIDTSSGRDDFEPDDECILLADRGWGWRMHLSVDSRNKLWSSYGPGFVRMDATSGALEFTSAPISCGTFYWWQGTTDANGIVWSTDWPQWDIHQGSILRWDPQAPSGPTNPRCISVPINPDGITIDRDGWVWASELYGTGAVKVSPDGETVLGPFANGAASGDDGTRGLANDANGRTWIATFDYWNGVNERLAQLDPDGRLVGHITLPSGTAGPVDVDPAGKVWVLLGDRIVRIDPALGPLGCGGTGCGNGTRLGAIDLSVPLMAAGWNFAYGTMATQPLPGGPQQGGWTVVQDGTSAGRPWGTITWNTEPEGTVPNGASLTVEARAADTEAALAGEAYTAVTNGGTFTRTGRFIQVRVTFRRSGSGETPVLSDIRIHAVANDPPNARDDALTTTEDTAGTVDVLANDADPDGNQLTITGSSNGVHGTVGCNAATCTYTPVANFNGTDAFTYTVSDGLGGSDTANVDVSVTAVNDAPTARDDMLTTSQGTPATVNVLVNDTDEDGDALTVSGATSGGDGTVSCTTVGSCTFTPAAGYNGPDQFGYTAADGRGGTDTATVTVTVLAPVPPPPPSAGHVSGSGAIAGTSLFKITFTVDAGPAGSFGFDAKKTVFRSTTVANFARVGNRASFDGAATWNGSAGYSYEASFVDNGTPGKKDTLDLVVRGPAGGVVFTTGGAKNLAAGSGNVTVS